jgi:hypothetical protein
MAFLDPVNTIATKRIIPGVVDLVFKNGPLLGALRRNCLMRYEGGPSWQENFMYGISNVSAYQPGDTFDITQVQLATGVTVTPRYYNVPVPAYIEKIKIEMNGPQAVFDYVDLLLQNAALTMSAKLAVDLYKWGQSGGASDRSLFINGLEEALNDGTTNGPNGSTFTSYLTLTRNDANIGSALNSPMTGPAASVSGALSYPILEQAWNSVVIGQEVPDLMVTTNFGLSYIKMAFQAQQRFEASTVDFGFQGVKFNGSTIVQDQYAPGTRTPSAQESAKLGLAALSGETLWFLNTKYLRLYVSTDPLFGFGFTGFMPAQNNSVVVGHYKFAGNLTCTAPQYGRVLYGFTA